MSAPKIKTKRSRHDADKEISTPPPPVPSKQSKRGKTVVTPSTSSSSPTILLTDLLLLIFAAVPSEHLISSVSVCRQWRSLILLPIVWRTRSFSLDEISYKTYEANAGVYVGKSEKSRRKREKCDRVHSFVLQHERWLQHISTLVWPFSTYFGQVRWSAVGKVMRGVTCIEYNHYRVHHTVGAALSALRRNGRLKRLHMKLENFVPSLTIALTSDLLQPLSTAKPFKINTKQAAILVENEIATSRLNEKNEVYSVEAPTATADDDSVIDFSLSLRAGFIQSQLTTSLVERVTAINFALDFDNVHQLPLRLVRLQHISGAISTRLLEQLRTITPCSIITLQLDGALSQEKLNAMAFLQPTLTSLTVEWNMEGVQVEESDVLFTLASFTQLRTLHIRRQTRSHCAAFNSQHLASLPRTLTALSFPYDATQVGLDDLASLSTFTQLTQLRLIARYVRQYGRWTAEVLQTISTATRERQLKVLSLEAHSLSDKKLSKKKTDDIQTTADHWQRLLSPFIDQDMTTLILHHADMLFTPLIRPILRQCIVEVKEANSDDVIYSV